MSHSPAPWTHRKTAIGVVVGPPDRAVATLGGKPNPADVSLVVAAPVMLAALKQVEPAMKSILGEMGNGPAADWLVINECLVAVGRAINLAEPKK